MRNILISFLFFVAPGLAQFPEIATTNVGDQVYFTTPFHLKTDPPTQSTELRLIRVPGGGGPVELFAERGNLARPGSGGNGDGTKSVHVSGDGQRVAFTLGNVCPTAEDCAPSTQTIDRAEVRGITPQVLGEGVVWMSRNGRWAVLSSVKHTFRRDFFLSVSTETTLINLDTKVRTSISPVGTRGNPLASDGTVFVQMANLDTMALGFFRNGQFTPLTGVTGPFSPIALSDNARKMVFLLYELSAPGQPVSPFNQKLVARDRVTSVDTVIFQGGDGKIGDFLGLSNDGRRMLFRIQSGQRNGQPRVADTESGESVDLPLPEHELAASGTISGDGNVVFLATDTGRLLRFDLDERGQPLPARELLPPTPYVCCGLNIFSPGEIARLEVIVPGSAGLDGRIRLGGNPLPVLSQDATGAVIQIPWEARPGTATALSVESPEDSPFSSTQQALIEIAHPGFVPADLDSNSILGVKIIRGDFSGPLTTQPSPGDIVHIYMTGLGPVRGSVKTGVPAPIDDLRPITGTLTCRFLPWTADAETLFAGLAPSMLGYYQVSFRLPSSAGSDPLTGLRCHLQTQGYSADLIYSQPLVNREP